MPEPTTATPAFPPTVTLRSSLPSCPRCPSIGFLLCLSSLGSPRLGLGKSRTAATMPPLSRADRAAVSEFQSITGVTEKVAQRVSRLRFAANMRSYPRCHGRTLGRSKRRAVANCASPAVIHHLLTVLVCSFSKALRTSWTRQLMRKCFVLCNVTCTRLQLDPGGGAPPFLDDHTVRLACGATASTDSTLGMGRYKALLRTCRRQPRGSAAILVGEKMTITHLCCR